MVWRTPSVSLQREEFVALARGAHGNVSRLCARFGISRKTGYKWLARAEAAARDQTAESWSHDRSHRPLSMPARCAGQLEAAVLEVRQEHPAWGGRKLRRRLELDGIEQPPAASTITAILRRHGRLEREQCLARGPLQRFERAAPNELWQMDFKGAVNTAAGPCQPLTVIDDHSRYALAVSACGNQRASSVREALEPVLARYGLPQRMLMDNGACWGRIEATWTVLEVWLLRLGIAVSHGRPYHPQTQGKCERFNRTLKAEALHGRNFADLDHCQRVFDAFRHSYNHQRPHEALGLEVPASRYRPSVFAYNPPPAQIEYLPDDLVRRVAPAGYFSLRKGHYHVGRAFAGQPVALRPTAQPGCWAVYYCQQCIAQIDENNHSCAPQR
jgi:transposase InsO family protein